MKARKAARRAAKAAADSTSAGSRASVSFDSGFLRLVLCIVLAVAILFVYAQSFDFNFVAYDDDQYVYDNPMVKQGITAAGLKWAFTTFHFANWHPLTWISYQSDAQLFGPGPESFHVVNVLFHIAGTVLLFLALFRLTRRAWRSLIVAAIFALHPLHVESVAWIAERKDVLSTFLVMTALLLYVRYTESPSVKRYLPVMLAFALSLMAKPMVVTFPFVLLLLDYWPLQRRRNIWIEKIPLFLMCVISSVLTFAAQRNYGAVISVEHVPFSSRLGNAVLAYAIYIRQAFLPTNLSALYPATPPVAGEVILALVFLSAVTAVVLRFARSRPYLFTGWFWYVGMLVPVIGIVQVGAQSHADRYMYVPLVGLSIAIVWIAADWVESRANLRIPALVATGVILLLFAAASWRQVGYWKDSRILFAHALAVTERNAIMHNNFGVILARAKDTQGAMDHYQQAVAIDPDYAEARANLGHELLRAGQFAAARDQVMKAVHLKPEFAMALADLSLLEAIGGNYTEAIRLMRHSLRLAPGDAETHNNFCFALQHAGNFDEAVVQCREALRLRPGFVEAQFNMNNALNHVR